MTRDPSKRFMGNPCKNGHAGERYVSDGRCVECRGHEPLWPVSTVRLPMDEAQLALLEEMRAALRKEVAEIMRAPL